MKGIRLILAFVLTMMLASLAFGGEDITLQKAQGEVTVRAGVAEVWSKAQTGDVLKPDVTIRTGKQSAAVILLPVSNQRINLPAEVILDISDMRELTQEELMLKLTMEKVRASSYEWKNKEMNRPNTTMVHGEPKDKKTGAADGNPELGLLQLNGTRVLYENGFYPTSALKTMEVLRRYPSLNAKFENRLLVAQALEKSNLKSEALNEYVSLSLTETLTKEQKEFLNAKISQMKRQ